MSFLTLLGMGIAAAGTGTSMAAASSGRNAANRAIQSGLQQQEEFQRQASPVFQQALQQTGPVNAQQQIGTGTQEATDLYGQINRLPLNGIVNPYAASPLEVARTNAQIAQQQKAQAALQGLRAWQVGQGLNSADVQNQLNVISNLAKSSANLTPIQAQLAGQSSANLSGLGSLMSTAGMLTGLAGVTRPGVPAWQQNISNRVGVLRGAIR